MVRRRDLGSHTVLVNGMRGEGGRVGAIVVLACARSWHAVLDRSWCQAVSEKVRVGAASHLRAGRYERADFEGLPQLELTPDSRGGLRRPTVEVPP